MFMDLPPFLSFYPSQREYRNAGLLVKTFLAIIIQKTRGLKMR
jgi:hypothetical protein